VLQYNIIQQNNTIVITLHLNDTPPADLVKYVIERRHRALMLRPLLSTCCSSQQKSYNYISICIV